MQYKELRKINVSQYIEKKNGLSYLSWSWALDQLLQLDNDATWEYLEPKKFGESLMVFCKVTAFGKSRTAQLPVMDIYAGEDLPIADQTEVPDNPLLIIAQEVTDQIKSGNIKSAHERCEGLNQTDKLGVWSLLNAKTKLALKKYLET